MAQLPVIHVLNGPNLNLLGEREPAIYGRETLADVQAICERAAGDATVVFRQTNHEGQLIDWVQESRTAADALVINPAGYGHTSIALLDALKTLSIPVIECHLSNPAAREDFRRHTYVSLAATGVIAGFGPQSYHLAVTAALGLIRERGAAAARSPQA
jgi:3-dehydroquinate dehydratase-2